jgi:hypothetical protein
MERVIGLSETVDYFRGFVDNPQFNALRFIRKARFGRWCLRINNNSNGYEARSLLTLFE